MARSQDLAIETWWFSVAGRVNGSAICVRNMPPKSWNGMRCSQPLPKVTGTTGSFFGYQKGFKVGILFLCDMWYVFLGFFFCWWDPMIKTYKNYLRGFCTSQQSRRISCQVPLASNAARMMSASWTTWSPCRTTTPFRRGDPFGLYRHHWGIFNIKNAFLCKTAGENGTDSVTKKRGRFASEGGSEMTAPSEKSVWTPSQLWVEISQHFLRTISPFGYGSKLGTPKLWMVNTKLD